ncbi:hypothetical protein Ancab_014975 [Ancistrocladus abbreviatus]
MQMLLRKNMRDVDKNVNNLNRETMGHAANNPVKTSNDNDVALFQEEDCTREKEVGPTSSPNRRDEEIMKMGGAARNEPNKYPMEGLEYGLDTEEACEEGWQHNKQTKLQCSISKEGKCGSDFEHQPEQPSELKWEKLKRTKLQKQKQIVLEGKRGDLGVPEANRHGRIWRGELTWTPDLLVGEQRSVIALLQFVSAAEPRKRNEDCWALWNSLYSVKKAYSRLQGEAAPESKATSQLFWSREFPCKWSALVCNRLTASSHQFVTWLAN